MNVRRQIHFGPRSMLLTVLLLIAAQTVVAAHLHDDALPDSTCVVCSSAHADKVDAAARAAVEVPPATVAPLDSERPHPHRTTHPEAPRVRGPPLA